MVNQRTKVSTTMRLSPKAREIVAFWAERWEYSATQVVEQAIRELHERYNPKTIKESGEWK